MTFKYLVLVATTLVCLVNSKSSYKLCVPSAYLNDCRQMLEVPTKSKTSIECVPARDRVECLSYVQQRQADFVPVDPEDMYVAANLPNQDFVVFQEYRTKEEPDAPFRYEAVIVVHKDLPITSLDQLKGLKSCHTGVNRNVGYKIPLTMLMKRSVFPKQNDPKYSPKENELRALATFFKQSCLVGKWSPDDKTTALWKSQYSQLCALCEHPERCDYPDNYSGYEGALRCLAHNGGEVAFTKVIYVKKFFGLPIGVLPAQPTSENPDNFAYLCVDGSKVPVREKPCSWAARPWQGLLGHNDVLASLGPLREKVRQLATAGSDTKPVWYTKVLGFSDANKMNYHVADNIPIKPTDYLSKANYTEVIERGHGPPEPVVRLCVTSNVALAKCRTMSVFAFSRDIRPRLDCVLEATENDCLKTIQDNGADMTSVDGLKLVTAANKYGLHPVFQETYGEKRTPKYAVAVVKKDSSIRNAEHLRGKKSCHSATSTFSALQAPAYYFINKNLIKSGDCLKNLGDFFSGGSCLPGVDKLSSKGGSLNQWKKQCSGDNDPAKCLAEKNSDVAFVSSEELSKFDASQHELLCLNRNEGGVDSLTNYPSCHIAMAPSRTWLSSKQFISDVAVSHTPLRLAEFLTDRTDLFNIYGEYLKNNNIIFNNAATGLQKTETEDFEKFKTIYETMSQCGLV